MTASAGEPADKDQSMDDILASIRRIMLDEQARLQDGPGAVPPAVERSLGADEEPVLILDASMAIEDGQTEMLIVSPAEEAVVMVSAESAEPPPVDGERTQDAMDSIVIEPVPSDPATGDVAVSVTDGSGTSAHTTVLGASGLAPVGGEADAQLNAQAIEALMAPAAAAAAAASVEALLKRLNEERIATLQPAPPVSPSIEEVVRSELRPFLKAWLDEHLPPLVERLVRVEITRLMGRSGF
jgi:cell pole-organizing protein PopZ